LREKKRDNSTTENIDSNIESKLGKLSQSTNSHRILRFLREIRIFLLPETISNDDISSSLGNFESMTMHHARSR